MNEGQYNELRRLLGELIKRHDRVIELLESQMTQPVQVARDEAEDKLKVRSEAMDIAFKKMAEREKTTKATKK